MSGSETAQVSLSVSHYEDDGCLFCEEDNLCFPEMITTALHEKHSNGQDIHIRDINDILEERLCEATVRYLEMIYLAEDEEMLKRYYHVSEYGKKITALGEYYKFHRDAPRVHAMPVERVLARHYDKHREHEYKQVRKLMKEGGDNPPSASEDSMSHHSSYIKKSKYSTVLGYIKQSFLNDEKKLCLADELVYKSESVALFEVYDKLNEIVKAAPDIQDMTGSYLQNSGVRNFENWMRSTTGKKHRRKEEYTQPLGEHDFTKKKVEFHTESKKKLILKYSNPRSTYHTLNTENRKALYAKHNTNPSNSSTAHKISRPLLRLTEYMVSVPLKQADKERSIEKIYGMHTDAKPTKIYQRILTAEKRPQDSTNGSSNRLEIGGRSKSIDRVTLEKMIDRVQYQQPQQYQQRGNPPLINPRPRTQSKRTRSVSRQRLDRYEPAGQPHETRAPSHSTSNLRGKKSLSTPALRNDIRISKSRPIESRKPSFETQKRTPEPEKRSASVKKTVNQLELLDIMIQKKTKVDPGAIYKRLKNIN